jgi:hypothetical protein
MRFLVAFFILGSLITKQTEAADVKTTSVIDGTDATVEALIQTPYEGAREKLANGFFAFLSGAHFIKNVVPVNWYTDADGTVYAEDKDHVEKKYTGSILVRTMASEQLIGDSVFNVTYYRTECRTSSCVPTTEYYIKGPIFTYANTIEGLLAPSLSNAVDVLVKLTADSTYSSGDKDPKLTGSTKLRVRQSGATDTFITYIQHQARKGRVTEIPNGQMIQGAFVAWAQQAVTAFSW